MRILTPAQQTSLLLIVMMVVLGLAAFFAVRAMRRSTGARGIRSARLDADAGGLPGPWQALREDVAASNRVMNRAVFERVRQIFLNFYADGRLTPADLTREYPAGADASTGEFLLVVDEHGRPSLKSAKEILESYQKTVQAQPAFVSWFRVDTIPEGELAGARVLLAARWLCHLAGLRHGTVEIFIDPPDLPGHTLAQVRGMEKFEAPGAFDIPCAGHISGVDAPEEALRKELSEELNLSLDDLYNLRMLERYNSYAPDENARSINNEHRVLYRAQLKPEAASRIRFSDGEVAGLSVFSVEELRSLVEKYPERVASGLADAIGFYE